MQVISPTQTGVPGKAALVRTLFGALIVATFGAIYARYVLGHAPLDIHELHWIWGDLSQVYVAWSQYLSDPNVHWLTSTRLSYPEPLSIALFDPMPLLLLAARPFAGFVQPGTQYLGYYFVACLVLQGVFGYFATLSAFKLVGYAQDVPSICAGVLAGALFASIPYTFYRFQGHTALSSQWVLVLSIWVALASTDWRSWRWCIANGAVVFLATGLNPYLALMVLVSDSVLTVMAWRRLRLGQVALRITVIAIIAAIGLWLFGFMGGATADSGGYGLYSMNLLGPLSSNGMARLLPLNIPDATGQQHFEGYTYLGLGILLLCLAGLVSRMTQRKQSAKFPFVPALLIALCCILLALSSTVTIAGHSLQVPIPKALTFLLSRFRGSGRLFWMAGFWLILASIAACTLRFGMRRAAMILAAAVLVQLVDIQPIAAEVRNMLASGNALRLENVPAGRYSAVLVYPAWQCDPHGAPGGGLRNYEAVGYFAASLHIPTNNFYAARTPADQTAFHCDYAARLHLIDPHAIYLLSEALFELYHSRLQSTHDCSVLEEDKRTWKCIPKSA